MGDGSLRDGIVNQCDPEGKNDRDNRGGHDHCDNCGAADERGGREFSAILTVDQRQRQNRECKEEGPKKERGVMIGGGGGENRGRFQERAPVAIANPGIEKWKPIQIDWGRGCGGQLPCGVNQKAFRTNENTRKRRNRCGSGADPEEREAIYADHEKQYSDELNGHIGHVQTYQVREQGDQLLRQGRVSGLREAGVPLCIPGIEPMVNVVGREENVEIRVVRPQRKLHQEERHVDRRSD